MIGKEERPPILLAASFTIPLDVGIMSVLPTLSLNLIYTALVPLPDLSVHAFEVANVSHEYQLVALLIHI